MKCKNCGTDLIGMEHACPMCGAPLPTHPPQAPKMISPQEVQMALPQSYQQNYQMNPVLIPLEEVQQTVNNGPTTNKTNQKEEVEQPKNDNKMFAIILGVVAVAAIIVGIFLGVLGTDEEEEPPKSISNKQVYAGYEFTLPLNYMGEIRDGLGLTIKDAYDNRFTITLDYSNKYEAYKASFQQNYPTQINDMIVKLSDREFISIKVGDVATNSVGAQYITASNDLAVTFVGFIVKGDYSAPSTAEYEILNTILNTAEKKSDIKINSVDNIGREGIKLPVFEQSDFDF